jgi:hypothetical protein
VAAPLRLEMESSSEPMNNEEASKKIDDATIQIPIMKNRK